jgi:5-methyltetrahydrofolate--homocysteine methyltransferase
MKSILNRIAEGQILVADGAWGTMLMEKGLKPGECADLWTLERPEVIREVASAYVEAGSDLIGTNSFGASSIKLERFGLSHKAEEINRRAAELSREVAGDHVHVLGTIGPSGKMVMMGEVTEAQLFDAYAEQVTALRKGGADAIIIETMSDPTEAAIAIRAIKENTDCIAICTMTYEKSAVGGYFTIMGTSPAEMLEKLSAEGADILGSNCGTGIEEMVDIARELNEVNGHIPLIIQANAGLPVYHHGEITYPGNPVKMTAHIPDLLSLGVKIIGGCCGTTPEHIVLFKQKIKEWQNNKQTLTFI